MRRKKSPTVAGAPAWMVTYSDLVTLILCFFVLLFAFSTIDVVKFKAVSDSFRMKSIIEGGVSIISPDPPLHANTNTPLDEDRHSTDEEQKQNEVQRMQEQQLDNLYEAIAKYLEDNKLESVITASRDTAGVTLEIRDRVLFDSGRADIKAEGMPFLARVAQLIQNMPNPIEIEGHTDNRPISTLQFPSNWELSTARASRVVRYLIDEHNIDPIRMTAVGYGEFRPIATNDTADDRALNRRVVIHIGKLSETELMERAGVN